MHPLIWRSVDQKGSWKLSIEADHSTTYTAPNLTSSMTLSVEASVRLHSCSLVSVIHSRERQMLWSLNVNSGCRSPRKISNEPRRDAVRLRKTNANWGIGFCVDKNSVSYQCKLRFDNTVYISNSRFGTCFFKVMYPGVVQQKAIMFTHKYSNMVTYLQEHCCSLG